MHDVRVPLILGDHVVLVFVQVRHALHRLLLHVTPRLAVQAARRRTDKPGLEVLWSEWSFRGYQSVQNAHRAAI